METVTGFEAADLVETLVDNTEDCSAKGWSKGDEIRVYVKKNRKDCGFLAINLDGSINSDGLGKQAGFFKALAREALEGKEVASRSKISAVKQVSNQGKDEDAAQFEAAQVQALKSEKV